MSVIVAIKEDGKVYMGADSQVTRGGSRRSLCNPSNYKAWYLNEVPHCMMGGVGLVRETNVIKVMDKLVDELDALKENINFAYLVKTIVPRLFAQVNEYNLLVNEGGQPPKLNGSYLFAYKDKLFQIGADGSVIEIDDYAAIGSASNEAMGSLLSTTNYKAKERIMMAIKASATNDIFVDFPLVIGDTSKREFEILYEDSKQIVGSLT